VNLFNRVHVPTGYRFPLLRSTSSPSAVTFADTFFFRGKPRILRDRRAIGVRGEFTLEMYSQNYPHRFVEKTCVIPLGWGSFQ